jgi:muramoyltetrapeptide carboxypeptidase LdcA involved in peptidoglycan recycling
VAVLSPSWGGPHAFPHVFDHGLAALRGWGLDVREYPSTRAPETVLHADPRFRADDLNSAFADPSIRAVIASIGGDDSIRILPFLDAAVIRANPKILMGFSDATTLLTTVHRLGMVTFHGPSVMAGLSQIGAFPPAYREHLRSMLFEPAPSHVYRDYGVVAEGYPDWGDPSLVGLANPTQPNDGPHVLQGSGLVTGELFGGCLEVLEWLRGGPGWPRAGEWAGRLLMFEPSEEKPGPLQVTRILRAFGALGVFDRSVGVSGVLVGRARDHSADEVEAFEGSILGVIAGELGRPDLPVVANLPFGHTDPQWVLPLGVRAELDPGDGSLRLVEPWLT